MDPWRPADHARGPGSAQLKRVATLCTPLAANPFETVARSLTFDVPGLEMRPQVVLPGLGYRVDLADERLHIVVECDSFTWHGKRSALASDARRYNAMVADGRLVVRLCYEDVMGEAAAVRDLLTRVVALAELLSEGIGALARSA